MLYAIKDREDLEKLEELASLQSQLKAVRFQDRLGKQIFMKTWKNFFNRSLKLLKISL